MKGGGKPDRSLTPKSKIWREGWYVGVGACHIATFYHKLLTINKDLDAIQLPQVVNNMPKSLFLRSWSAVLLDCDCNQGLAHHHPHFPPPRQSETDPVCTRRAAIQALRNSHIELLVAARDHPPWRAL